MEFLERVEQASSYRFVTAVMGPSFTEDIQATAVMGPSFAEGIQAAAATFATSTASASFAFVVVTAGRPFLSHPNKQLARGFIEGHCYKGSN